MTAFTSKLRSNPCYPASSHHLTAGLTQKHYQSPKHQCPGGPKAAFKQSKVSSWIKYMGVYGDIPIKQHISWAVGRASYCFRALAFAQDLLSCAGVLWSQELLLTDLQFQQLIIKWRLTTRCTKRDDIGRTQGYQGQQKTFLTSVKSALKQIWQIEEGFCMWSRIN